MLVGVLERVDELLLECLSVVALDVRHPRRPVLGEVEFRKLVSHSELPGLRCRDEPVCHPVVERPELHIVPLELQRQEIVNVIHGRLLVVHRRNTLHIVAPFPAPANLVRSSEDRPVLKCHRDLRWCQEHNPIAAY